MNGNLRRTRRIGIKGEKRVVAAMLVARNGRVQRSSVESWGSEGGFRLRQNSEGRGARVEIVFFDLAVSVKRPFAASDCKV